MVYALARDSGPVYRSYSAVPLGSRNAESPSSIRPCSMATLRPPHLTHQPRQTPRQTSRSLPFLAIVFVACRFNKHRHVWVSVKRPTQRVSSQPKPTSVAEVSGQVLSERLTVNGMNQTKTKTNARSVGPSGPVTLPSKSVKWW